MSKFKLSEYYKVDGLNDLVKCIKPLSPKYIHSFIYNIVYYLHSDADGNLMDHNNDLKECFRKKTSNLKISFDKIYINAIINKYSLSVI